ncbi:hypothetical protein BN903_75 [Halorubrum sp. AJ67]|nr:hypothetical protein BN903_75 [Halorubrum sp. AJ67]
MPPMSGLADGQPIPANTFGCQGLRLFSGGQVINLLLWSPFGLPPTTEVGGFRPCIAVNHAIVVSAILERHCRISPSCHPTGASTLSTARTAVFSYRLTSYRKSTRYRCRQKIEQLLRAACDRKGGFCVRKSSEESSIRLFCERFLSC